MAAPEHVSTVDKVAPPTGLDLPVPTEVPRPARPAEPGVLDRRRPGMGSPGPDQGYALVLVRAFRSRVVLAPGEHLDDVLAGGVAVAMARASVFGRAPVIHDLELAFAVWGFLSDKPPAELVAERGPRFAGAAHHYWDRRALVDAVPEATLRLTPAEVARRIDTDWRALLDLS